MKFRNPETRQLIEALAKERVCRIRDMQRAKVRGQDWSIYAFCGRAGGLATAIEIVIMELEGRSLHRETAMREELDAIG